MTVKKTKRRLKGKLVVAVSAGLLIILTLIKTPILITERRLENLGYSPEAVAAIRSKGISGQILGNKYYTEYLNQEVVKDDFRKDYLILYTISDHVTNENISMFERLRSLKGYSNEEMIEIFKEVGYYDMQALCLFDKFEGEDLQKFIEDAKAHPATKEAYTYKNEYISYKDDIISDPSAIDVLVNKEHGLGEYAAEKLVNAIQMNAIPGVQLESRALEAFDSMCKNLRENDMAIYAVAGYRSYDRQKELYISDESLAKAGHDERQTGLSVSIVSSENESAARFKETAAYAYLLDHAHEFGFIFRYPEGKEAITGFEASSNYLRFVGIELATAIHNSGLCFEEYVVLNQQ